MVSMSPVAAEIKVIVNRKAKVHEGDAARNLWLGFDAYQTWTVVPRAAGPDRGLHRRQARPMPSSAAL